MLRLVWTSTLAVTMACVVSVSLPAGESEVAPRVQPAAGSPLHQRIDQLVDFAAIGPLSPRCSDADFIRRISLDLRGVIPTPERVSLFLADSSPHKRERLIDEQLSSPEFVRQMTIQLGVWLLERQSDAKIGVEDWERFLFKSLDDGKTLAQLFRELVTADGADPVQRPAALFLLAREAEPNAVTRDLGRLAFGMDLQCAQCHNHPLVDDYSQEDYYGLFAFVHRTYLFTDPNSKQVQLAEKADGEVGFKSVFTGDSRDRTLPRLPKGTVLPHEPRFRAGDEYKVKPDKSARAVPNFSRRSALASMLVDNRQFRRNLANRLWAQMFGRGIVHPFDFHHLANPPANPALLRLLADELKANDFQLRDFLRELALTRAYQRSCDAPPPETVNFADIAARGQQLSRERALKVESFVPLRKSLADAAEAYQGALATHEKVTAEFSGLEKKLGEASKILEQAVAARQSKEKGLANAEEQAKAVSAALAKTNEAVAKLPEDKLLAEAAAKISERAAHFTGVVAAATKAVAEEVTRHQAAAREVDNAEAALAKAVLPATSAEAVSRLDPIRLAASEQLEDAQFELRALESRIALCQAAAEYATIDPADAAKVDTAWKSLVERWTIAGQIAPLKPLTPEQLAVSAMQATGTLVPLAATAEAKIDQSPAEEWKTAPESEKARIRSRLVQLELLSQLRGTFKEFVTHYGGLPGEDFQATVNQALFMGNGSVVDEWLKPAGDNLAARLVKMENPELFAHELYFAVLSRPPGEAEKQDVAAFFQQRPGTPAQAIAEMIWALLSATEFRFNH